MKKILLLSALVVAFATSAFAQTTTSDKKSKTATPAPATTTAPAATQGAAAVSTDKKAKTATAPTATAPAAKSGKPTRGSVINVMDFVSGGKGVVNKAQAEDVVKHGGVLGLMVGTGKSAKIYMIYNADGSAASAKLASLADAPVGVVGKTMSKGGVNIIVADIIETMK